MSVIKTYTLNKVRQLIDLNGDTTNFEISFKASTKNKEPFEMLIVDQTTLDNTPTLEFKKAVNGEIAGNIVQDKNIYQNYFMVLKADNPCQCDVEIIKKELPKTLLPTPSLQPQSPIPQPASKSINVWFILLLLGVGAGVVWYFFFRNRNQERKIINSPLSSPRQVPVGRNMPITPVGRQPQVAPVLSPAKGNQNTLLDRLKNLNLP